MRNVKTVVLLGLGVLGTVGAAACGSDSVPARGGGAGDGRQTGGGEADGTAACERACTKSAAASCPKQSSCVSDCKLQRDRTPIGCAGATDALLECLASRATNFTCKEGVAVGSGCDEESQAILACLQRLGSGSSGGVDAGGGATDTPCGRACAASASAKCADPALCVAVCQAQQDQTPADCKAAGSAVLDCTAKRATGFTCSNGVAVALGCDREGGGLLSCLQGLSGGTSQCGSFDLGATAACNSCIEDKCCTEKSACSNDAECMAVVSCRLTRQCTDDACFAQCDAAYPSGSGDLKALFACAAGSCSADCQ